MKIREIFISILRECVYGGHFLSFGALSVILSWALLFNIKITWDSLLVVYLGAQIIYLYNRYKEFDTDFLTNPERTAYFKKYIKHIPSLLMLYSAIIVIILLYYQKVLASLFAFLLIFLGVLYSIFFKKLTKKIVSFKVFFVALIWALLIVFMAFYYSTPLNISLLVIFIFVYLRFFIHESFSDIKDIEGDKKEKLLTLPIVFGKEKIIRILSIVNILSMIPIVAGIYLHFLPVCSLMLLFTVPYTIYYLRKANKLDYNQNFLYNVLGDGEFVLWSFFIFLGRFIL